MPKAQRQYEHYEQGESPLILCSPHGARFEPTDLSILPDAIIQKVKLDDPDVVRSIRAACDVAAPDVMDFKAQDRHHRVSTDMPRFLVDVNRLRKDKDDLCVFPKEERRRQQLGHAHGVVWRSTLEVVHDLAQVEALLRSGRLRIKDALLSPYAPEEFEALLSLAYDPYQAAVERAIAAAKARHGFAIAFNGHTFPDHTATKIQNERHRGAYIAGPKATQGNVTSMDDFRKGLMPDAFVITNCNPETRLPQSCHPRIRQIIIEEFERAGLIAVDGFGPFQGDIGAEAMHAKPEQDHHVVAVELVGFGDLEPDRINGSFAVNGKRVAELRGVYCRIFDRLGALTLNDLQTA